MDVTKIDKTNLPERSGRTSNKLEKSFDPKIMPMNDDGIVVTISPEALKNSRIDISVRPKGSKEGFPAFIKQGLSILNWLKNLLIGNSLNN